MKENILVSACLIGDNVKYDGGNNYQPSLERLKDKYNFIKICPEVFGGLSIPRRPAEEKDGIIYNDLGEDVTSNFVNGATKSLELAKKYNVKIAILKGYSPSCSPNGIYDGTFNHIKIEGMGVCAKMLKEAGIILYSEKEIDLIK